MRRSGVGRARDDHGQIRRESLAPRLRAPHRVRGRVTALALVIGVLSLSVGSPQEIAVRKAIGAQQRDILRSVLSEGGG